MMSIPVFTLLAITATVHAAILKQDGPSSKYDAYEGIEDLLLRKPTRTFDMLKLGGGYGIAKRYSSSNNDKSNTKTEKHRRGPLNGLIPGGAFGRAARNKFYTDQIMLYPDVESRNEGFDDGQLAKALLQKETINQYPETFDN